MRIALIQQPPIKQKFPSESKSKAFFFGALSFHLKEHLKCECNKIVFKLLFTTIIT